MSCQGLGGGDEAGRHADRGDDPRPRGRHRGAAAARRRQAAAAAAAAAAQAAQATAAQGINLSVLNSFSPTRIRR